MKHFLSLNIWKLSISVHIGLPESLNGFPNYLSSISVPLFIYAFPFKTNLIIFQIYLYKSTHTHICTHSYI